MFALLKKARHLPLLLRTLGVRGTLRYARERLLPAPPPPAGKLDVVGFYRFLQAPAVVPTPTVALAARTLNWVIPSFQLGSGGHLNIFRMVYFLEKLGHRQHLVIIGETPYRSGDDARQQIREHFVSIEASVGIGEGSLQPAEFTVATSWDTAYAVRRFAETRHRIYFIQDMEADFFPRSSSYAFAEATYRFDFVGITAGAWLAELMHNRYGMRTFGIGFSYDKERYRPLPRRDDLRRVFFYARHVTPRRGFELGLLALERVSRVLPDVHFILAGWDSSVYEIPFPHLDAGVVSLDGLPDLYSQCDVALVISLTNISLLPLEVMACGCPVVSNRGRNVEWLLTDRQTAMLTDATPEALAEGLIQVLEDDALRRRLAENGLALAQSTDWANEARRVHEYLEIIRQEA